MHIYEPRHVHEIAHSLPCLPKYYEIIIASAGESNNISSFLTSVYHITFQYIFPMNFPTWNTFLSLPFYENFFDQKNFVERFFGQTWFFWAYSWAQQLFWVLFFSTFLRTFYLERFLEGFFEHFLECVCELLQNYVLLENHIFWKHFFE